MEFKEFKGKRALVTDGAGAISQTVTYLLTKFGATVIAVDSDGEKLQKLYKGRKDVIPVVCDVSKWEATKTTISKHLPIDFLLNNAANVEMGPILKADEKAVDWHFNSNFKSMMNVSQIVAKDLIARKSKGAIVNMSSVCSKGGYANTSLYAASKAAVDSITESMAVEFATHGIRVNCIRMGPVNGPSVQAVHDYDPAAHAYITSRTPTKKYAEPEEVADAAFYLLSDKASAITGVKLPVDEGFTANPL